MQTYYATHLPLPRQQSGQELNVAVDALARWAHRRFGVTVRPLAKGEATGRDASVYWSMLTGQAGGLFGMWVDQPDTTDPGWRWRTYADIGVERDRAWFRVRVHLYSRTEGLLTNPRVVAGRPGVVRRLVDELNIELDGRVLGHPLDVTADSVGHYLAFLEDKGRQLPIVAISRDEGGATFIDPEDTSDKLLGLAHVAVVDDAASWLVTEAIGKSLSCYRGAVRIYWPQFGLSDDPFHHRLFVGGGLDFLGPIGLQQELFLVLGRLAGLTIDEPDLRRTLVLEARTDALAKSIETRAAALAKVNEAAHSKGSVSAAEFAEFAAEYDELDRRYASLDLDVVELQHEIERVRKERDDARTNLVELSRSFQKSRDDDSPAAKPVSPPSTVREAVERAKQEAKRTVFLDEALTSAQESRYGDPGRVLDDLRLIDDIAQDWAAGELSEGPHMAFKKRCSAYRDGIGQIASTKYASDYERQFEGQSFMLQPHIARGIGAVTAILRVYMHFDTERKRIIVGHVGRKLRDESNKN